MNFAPIVLSFQLALVTTLCLLIIGIPLAYWLSESRSPIKPILETIISLPLVLPPTVIGFYLLIAFSPDSWAGYFLKDFLGVDLIFSFTGLVIGSIIYSLPFMIHPVQAGFSNLPDNLSEASYVLGKSRWTTLKSILLPNIKPSLFTGIVLSFAHTVGEFGVVLMIGGNIARQTRVASIAIYDQVEALNYGAAHQYSLILLSLSFGILLLVYGVNGHYFKKVGRVGI